jgi:hypothetical protein
MEFFLGKMGQTHAVFGQKCLVGGNNRLARPKRCLGRSKRDTAFTADQFHEKIDVRGLGQSHTVVEPGVASKVDPPVLGPI